MDISVLDKKIDELFCKLDNNIKELDKESIKKYISELKKIEKEYSNKCKGIDEKINQYNDIIMNLKMKSSKEINQFITDSEMQINEFTLKENSLFKSQSEELKSNIMLMISKENDKLNEKIKIVREFESMIDVFQKNLVESKGIEERMDYIESKAENQNIKIKQIEENANISTNIEVIDSRINSIFDKVEVLTNEKNKEILYLYDNNEELKKKLQDSNSCIHMLEKEVDSLKKQIEKNNEIIEEKIKEGHRGIGAFIKSVFNK